ncbi:MAG: hypothetical protein COC19_06035, partial [SAR86 cluster bacterium]
MANSWDAKQYIDKASYVAIHGQSVMGLLSPQAGENILDLGCGDGLLTQKIQDSGAMVRGIDSSASMVAAAQETIESIDNLANEMMGGKVFTTPSAVSSHFNTYSLKEATYTDDPAYPGIERLFAESDHIEAGRRIRELMFKYCQIEASLYLDVDLESL